ncbi:MAG: hypothetical protein WCF98_09420 [Synechococcus sp. ELA057]
MNTPLLALTALTLVVCGGVAWLPAVIRPVLPRALTLPPANGARELWVVQAPQERWFLNGRAVSGRQLLSQLQRGGRGSRIHLLPSAALSVEEVHQGLRRLRQGGATVDLELPEAARR